LVQLIGLNISVEYPKTDILSIFRGMLAEQFVGQELLAATDSELYYWSREERSSQAETDYLIVHNGKIIPVEVKSGSKGRLRSLHLLHETFPNIDESIVFSSAAYIPQNDEKMRFLPLYYAGTLFRH
jgi:predicted AAA+ superfamily ATPase